MAKLVLVALLPALCLVMGQPLEHDKDMAAWIAEGAGRRHRVARYVASGPANAFADNYLTHMRTKRSLAEECEELELCRLHARSSHSFLASFELYFVKENARLWDHRSRSLAECERRYSACAGGASARALSQPQRTVPRARQPVDDYDEDDEYA